VFSIFLAVLRILSLTFSFLLLLPLSLSLSLSPSHSFLPSLFLAVFCCCLILSPFSILLILFIDIYKSLLTLSLSLSPLSFLFSIYFLFSLYLSSSPMSIVSPDILLKSQLDKLGKKNRLQSFDSYIEGVNRLHFRNISA